MIEIPELVATFFGFLYIILIIFKKPVAWLFGILSSLIYVQLCWNGSLYIQAVLQSIYVVIGLIGFVRWKTVNSHTNTLSKNQKIILYGLAFMASFFLGYIMSFTNQQLPYLDSIVSTFGIVATYLTTEKHIENWIIWIFVNLSSIILFAHQELYLSAYLFGAYLLLSIIGLISWNKEKRREKTI